MRARRLAQALLLALAASGAAAADGVVFPDGQAALAREPAALVEKLRSRHLVLLEEVQKDAGDLFVAYVLFDRPPARVYELLSDSQRQSEFRPDLNESRLVKKLPDGEIDEHHMRILFIDIVYRLRYSLEPARARIAWVTDPDFENSLRRVEGFWELYALEPAQTLGRFGTLVDVGPALPRSFQGSLTRRNILRNVENIRLWVESDGTWRP